MLKLNSWKSDLKTRCFMMFLFSIVFVCLRYIQSKHIQAIQYTSIHFVVDSKKIQNIRRVPRFFGSPLWPLRPFRCPPGAAACSEATTTSSWRPSMAASARCATSCGRCPAPWPGRTATGGPRCTRRRSEATRRSAGCCWRGPRWTPGTTKASRP